MKRTMKAAVVREFGKPLAIEDVPIPEVGPGQVLVKVRHAECVAPIYTRPAATGRSSRTCPSFRAMKA